MKILAAVLVFSGVVSAAPASPGAPSGLRCEYLENPTGIDVARPRFSWALEHTARAQRQTAYQMVVSSAPTLAAADQWDSGRIPSAQSVNVAYAGKPLASGRTYYWKVRYWDAAGAASPYSAVASFGMGLLAAADWKARWIAGKGLLRTEFTLPARPLRARAYISAVGWYELRLNGAKVGRFALDPGWTDLDRRVLYTTYDVTALLRPGRNAVGIMLGKGWSTSDLRPTGAPPVPQAALLQVEVELENGGRFTLASDGSWRTLESPILSDHIYHGETYDARRETPGWDRPGFEGSGLEAVSLPTPPKGRLAAQAMPPIEVVASLIPQRTVMPEAGVYVFDMGRNFSGWARLRVRGPRGTRVQMRFAETLQADGSINTQNLRSARATDVYVLRGGEEETWEPRFTYHGFRYVEVTGFPGTPGAGTLTGRVVHSGVALRGGFSCSNPLLNRLHDAAVWTQRSNLHSVPSDCPQRNERNGWLADAHISSDMAMWNLEMAAFYSNFVRDIRESQSPEGDIGDVAPKGNYGRSPGDPAWASAYPIFCWNLYRFYGDRRILEEHYDSLAAFVRSLERQAAGDIIGRSPFGDWIAIEKTPGALVSTAYYYHDADLMARIADVLGKKDDAARWRELAARIKRAFLAKFFDPAANEFASGTQAAKVFALQFGLLPEKAPAVRTAVARTLGNQITYAANTHLTTGIHATKYVLDVLGAEGRADLAYDLVAQTTYPSWGYMLENGATTIWELWQNKTGPGMNSHSHPALASVGAWLYTTLGGLGLDAEKPGFERIRMAPQTVGDLRWASASVQTLRGPVSCSWRRSNGRLLLEAVIPVGSEAEIHIPKPGQAPVSASESGRVFWERKAYRPGVPGLLRAREGAQAVVVTAGSGSYSFEIASE
jgi:alpha-L-rhamnosidase